MFRYGIRYELIFVRKIRNENINLVRMTFHMNWWYIYDSRWDASIENAITELLTRKSPHILQPYIFVYFLIRVSVE